MCDAGFDKPPWMAKNTTTPAAMAGREFLYNANRSRTMQLEFNSMAGTAPNQVPDRTGERVAPPPDRKAIRPVNENHKICPLSPDV